MLRDNPLIEMTERTGYPYPVEDDPICPECGAECEEVYVRNDDGEILGCNHCVRVVDVYDCPEILEK